MLTPENRATCIFCDAPLPNSNTLTPQPKQRSTASVIVLFAFGAVLVPAAAFIIGLILSQLIPGCHCDEGAGCHGCGLNWLLEQLLFGGFVVAIFCTITVLPGGLFIAAIISLFSKNKNA